MVVPSERITTAGHMFERMAQARPAGHRFERIAQARPFGSGRIRDFVRCFGLSGVIALTSVACAGVAPPVVDRSLEAAGQGLLVVVATAEDVTVLIDDRPVLRAGDQPRSLPLAPGVYRLRAEAEGYLTERYDVEVIAGQTIDLRLTMWPSLP